MSSAADYRVRRAIVDDRPWLVPLWQSLRLPVSELERRLTEFQVIETADGQPLGALGFQIAGRDGCIHSEAYADFGFADHFRPLLWERVQKMAANHSLLRIWTQEQSPFWTRNGFRSAAGQVLESLPAAWKSAPSGWLMIQLREDPLAGVAFDKQIEILMQQEKQRTERAFQQGKTLKTVATLVAVILAIFVIGAAAYMLSKNPGMLHRR